MPKTIRILLADDHNIVRTGLKALLDHHNQFEVVAEAKNGTEAIEKAKDYHPDVAVVDIRMPGISGIEVCRRIVGSVKGCKVIMLTAYADDDLLLAAIRAGASSFVLKRIGTNELIHAIEYVSKGDGFFKSSMITKAFNDNHEIAETPYTHKFSDLTPREITILSLLPKGMTNHEIAVELNLGEGTVRNYVSNILGKISVANRAGAAAFAVKHDIEGFVDIR